MSFHDRVPIPDAPDRAVRTAVELRERIQRLAPPWQRKGHDLGIGVGIAQCDATLGQVGFPGRYDDAAIGTVINLATRLCAVTQPGQILVTPQVRDGITGPVRTRGLGPWTCAASPIRSRRSRSWTRGVDRARGCRGPRRHHIDH